MTSTVTRCRTLLRDRGHDIALAFTVTAGLLLVIEHWTHFDTSDFIILALLLAATGMHLFIRRGRALLLRERVAEPRPRAAPASEPAAGPEPAQASRLRRVTGGHPSRLSATPAA